MCLEPLECTARKHCVTESIRIMSNVEFKLTINVNYLLEH